MIQIPLVLPVAFAAADRLFGGGGPAFKGKKAAVLALALAAGFLGGGIPGLMLGAAWFVYRAIPFFGGSAAPITTGQDVMALVRHGLVILPAAAIAYWRGLVEPRTALIFLGYAAGATMLAVWYGWRTTHHIVRGEWGGEENAYIEPIRGAFFGAAVWLALAIIA